MWVCACGCGCVCVCGCVCEKERGREREYSMSVTQRNENGHLVNIDGDQCNVGNVAHKSQIPCIEFDMIFIRAHTNTNISKSITGNGFKISDNVYAIIFF